MDKAPMYFTPGGIPLTEEEVAASIGVSTEQLRLDAEKLVGDHMMCKDSEGNYHHSPISDALFSGFRQAFLQ